MQEADNRDDMQGLLEALEVTPDNGPLRRLVADRWLSRGDGERAEQEYKRVLQLQGDDLTAQLGFARACLLQGKTSIAAVVLEDLVKQPAPPDGARALYQSLLPPGEDAPGHQASDQAAPSDELLCDDEHDDTPGFAVDGRQRDAYDEEEPDDSDIEIARPSITFEDVGGMEQVKEEITIKIILPMTNKDLYRAYNKQAGGGILLYGPPGCGKTHLARATAGQVKAGFISVGLNDVLDMWIGQSEHRLHALFEQARRAKPCVMFFDEVDALGASRSDMRKSSGRQLINQFLSELDGIDADNDGVLILAATNAPWHLDSAFRRPGRFDRIVFVPPPDEPARAEILRLLLVERPTDNVNVAKLAARFDQFSGADLKAVVDRAVEAKLREAMKLGRPIPLTTKDLITAGRKVKSSTREWLATARNYAMYANEGGIYDDILKFLKLS